MVHLYPDKFGDHKHCNMGDLIIAIYHVASCDHLFKRSCEVMVMVRQHPAKFGGYK